MVYIGILIVHSKNVFLYIIKKRAYLKYIFTQNKPLIKIYVIQGIMYEAKFLSTVFIIKPELS